MAGEKPTDAPAKVPTDVPTDAPTEEPEEMMREVHEDGCHVAWTRNDIDVLATMDQVRSNQAGAIVMFSGTTRDNSFGRQVDGLVYYAYDELVLKTMLKICRSIKREFSLLSIAIVHRFGNAPIGKESIVIAVSAPHRQAAWRAGEKALEECKRDLEIWKAERLAGVDEICWRSNRDDATGIQTPPE